MDLVDDSVEGAGDPGVISEEEREEKEGAGTPRAKVIPSHEEAVSSVADHIARTKIDVTDGATPVKQGGGARPDVVSEDATSSPYSKYIGVVKRLPSPAGAANARHHLGKRSTVITDSFGMGAGHVV